MPIRANDERLRPDLRQFLIRHGLQVRDGVIITNLCNRSLCDTCYEPDPNNPTPDQHSSGMGAEQDAGTLAWRQRYNITLAPGIAMSENEIFTGCLNPLCRSHYIPIPYGEVRYNTDYISLADNPTMSSTTWVNAGNDMQRQREEEALRRRDEERDTRRREESRRRRIRRDETMGRDVRVRVEDGSKPSRLTRPYGVEIEATFDEEPFPAGYSNAPPMPPKYYGGWKAKTDSSIRAYGIEAVSPILRGAGSLGEIIHTADMMVNDGGSINRTCGFHVTLSTYDTIEQMQIMRFFTLLEEAAFAVSANWERFRGSEFSAPMKRDSFYRYIRDGDYFREKYAAVHNKSDCIEFRYPSGTMEPEQIVLNVGLTQLFVRMAAGLDHTVIQKIMEQGLNIHNLQIDATERVRMFTLYGLTLLHAQGWCEGGSFWGVAYNPNNHPTYTIRDKMREHEHQIVLPDGDKLFDQYRYNTTWWGEHLGIREDVESIINGDPTSTVLETLEIITDGEPLVLPQAGNMKAIMSYA